MNKEHIEQWLNFNHSITAPVQALGKASTDILRKSAERHLEIINDSCSIVADQLRRATNLRKPEDFVTFQKECTNEYLNAFSDNVQKIAHLNLENVEDLLKLYNSALAKATEKVSAAAEKATESATR